jgi:hypothetical protein
VQAERLSDRKMTIWSFFRLRRGAKELEIERLLLPRRMCTVLMLGQSATFGCDFVLTSARRECVGFFFFPARGHMNRHGKPPYYDIVWIIGIK